MGWNNLQKLQGPLFEGISEADNFYFVHSYHCVPRDRSLVLAECDYGGAFTAAIGRGRVFATQFHPEKSQAKGIQLYRNFVELAGSV